MGKEGTCLKKIQPKNISLKDRFSHIELAISYEVKSKIDENIASLR